MNKISENVINKTNELYNTQRARYYFLHYELGYSLRQIANAYQVNHRTVWERLHDRKYSPSEAIKPEHKKIFGNRF